MGTILTTGGTGLIGAHAMRILLEAGHLPVAFDLLPNAQNLAVAGIAGEVEVIRGDVQQPLELLAAAARHNVDRILHLAAKLHAGAVANPHSAVGVNCVGTANVLEVARSLGMVRVCYASSMAALGPASGRSEGLVGEDEPASPSTLYGATKLLGEVLARTYREEFGLDVIAIRPTFAYGFGRLAGVTGSFNELIRSAALGETYCLGPPLGMDTHLQAIYVRDIASYLAAGVTVARTQHAVFNAPGPEVFTVREIVTLIKELVPDADITVELEHGEDHIAAPLLDDSRIRTELNVEPAYPMREGLLEAMRMFRAAGPSPRSWA